MDKKEAKKLGAWISLLGGGSFVLAALTAAYIAFFMNPRSVGRALAWIGHTFHPGSK